MEFRISDFSELVQLRWKDLALAGFLVNYNGANRVITGASSHNSATEKQFRYPTEYGGQKPPTAQWTVTGAGYAVD